MLGLERLDGVQIARNRGGWGQVREIQHQQLFGKVADPERVVHHQRRFFQTVQKMGRGDVMHVKGRVLSQPDHVEFRQVHFAHLTQLGMIALHPLHGKVLPARSDAPLLIGQMIRRVEKQRMPPRLRLFGQPKTAVCVDIHVPDRVHLKSDLHRGTSRC